MQQIVECIPNFSDGRRPEVYNSIAEAIRAVPGVRILHLGADTLHNRTVITFVGSLTAVEDAAFHAIAKAAELIDMDRHEGEHARIGAADVCPFVPIKGVTIDDCIALAERLGKRVGEELGIAVYLYGNAATSPERVRLADIRRGEYEAWKREIGTAPERQPDFGPAVAKKWGATSIGVRPPLIAYNLFLNTSNVSYAKKIAKAIRHSSGGLRYIRAKGFLVDGQAQVSMNLTNFEKTPVYRMQEMVKREAAYYGLTVTKAELVGMIPQKALIDSAKWYLQLDGLREDQILEYRLYDEDDNSSFVPTRYLEATATAKPTPGGGSVAALAGALGAALTQMMAGLTVDRKQYRPVDSEARAILADAEEVREKLTAAITEDSAAYSQLVFARRNKTVPDKEQAEAIQSATIHAAKVPLRVARLSRDVALLAQEIVLLGNVNAVADAATGALLAQAAVKASDINVRTNALGVDDTALTDGWKEELVDIVADTNGAVTAVLETAQKRGGY
ncbi:MAG: glutamate formimidoyltransferase [Chloroflexota bacterium]